MRKGLLAQWRRGIALRGIAGATLLMVPVLVAATIGFGDVGSGLTSLASGPSESSVNPLINGRKHGSQSIERLSATLPRAVTATRQSSSQGPGGAGGGESSGGTATSPTGVGTPPSGGAGGAGATGGGVGQSTSPSNPPSGLPASQPPNIVTQLLQGLLGQSSP